MLIGELIALLQQVGNNNSPVTILGDDGDEYPISDRLVTREGGGAAPEFVAINVHGPAPVERGS